MDRSAIVYVTIAYLAIALMERSDVSVRENIFIYYLTNYVTASEFLTTDAGVPCSILGHYKKK
jgi:hypothetical protein